MSAVDVALQWVGPLTVLAGLGLIVYKAILYILSLSVTGKANEWVLIINNGKLRQAGIGLSTMRMPGDVIARMPSKVNKVEFKAQQVTEEMSGVEVSAMICWTINREGDGPLKAYTNLGSDISSGRPNVANGLISSMSSAVMRNRIANTKMDNVLQNRQMLRETVRSEISKVVTGWGIWLETVEITDVKICSGELFKNLQTTFREDQSKQAQILTMDVNNQIAIEQSHYNMTERMRAKDQENVTLDMRLNMAYDQKKDELQIFEQEKSIEKEEIKDAFALLIWSTGKQSNINKLGSKLKFEFEKVNVDTSIKKQKDNLKTIQQNLAFQKDDVQRDNVREDLISQNDRDGLLMNYKFEKEQLADAHYMSRKRTEVITNVYKSNKMYDALELYCEAGKDPVAMVLDNFLRDVVEE